MDIAKFIEETLLGIKGGIEGANKKTTSNYLVMMHQDKVDFDVALTVLDKTAGTGGAKIGVASIATLGGDVSVENQNTKNSRIKFSIKINFNGFGSVSKDN